MSNTTPPAKMTTSCEPAYLRPAEAARRCSVSTRTLRDWMRRGVLPYHKVSRRVVLFAVADLDRALDRFKVEAWS